MLPCGHYTTGETPFQYIDGWYMGSFVYRAFKELRRRKLSSVLELADRLAVTLDRIAEEDLVSSRLALRIAIESHSDSAAAALPDRDTRPASEQPSADAARSRGRWRR